jgi:hypothetical protein
MNPQMLLNECSAAGVSIQLIGDKLKLRGTAENISAVSERVRANKAALLAYLSSGSQVDLVAEFMQVDGMTREEAQAMATISIQPRTPAVWLSMIADLNSLINAYCASVKVSNEAKQRMFAASYSQSLSSIPHAIDWFRAELRALEHAS